MTYFTHTEAELRQAGIQEGELAVYTGTLSPPQVHGLSDAAAPATAYVYHWRDGGLWELHTCFQHDGEGQDVLEARAGDGTYVFLRDRNSGYIRQVSGPAKPIVVVNLGAIPLRVDTLLGKFTVYAGTVLRLDENAPRRERKMVLLTFGSRKEQPLECAELWDGAAWRKLNIREDPASADEDLGLAVLDGSAIVQYMTVNRKGEILMPDSPEPDPDYEIYLSGTFGKDVTLCFNRSDYRDGRVVQRTRSSRFIYWSAPWAYDLQKLRESPTMAAARQCTAKLPGREAFDLGVLTPPGDDGGLDDLLDMDGEDVRLFHEDDGPGGPPEEAPENGREDRGREGEPASLPELFTSFQPAREGIAPEPPEDFPD